MWIIVNGEEREVAEVCTVSQLLDSVAAAENSAVVELNGEILPQEHWPAIGLQTGDRLEILVFMGGG